MVKFSVTPPGFVRAIINKLSNNAMFATHHRIILVSLKKQSSSHTRVGLALLGWVDWSLRATWAISLHHLE